MGAPTEKLVRHHIADAPGVVSRMADKSEMLGLLRAKLLEETEELCQAIDSGVKALILEEAIDVYEVMMAFRVHLGHDIFDKLDHAKAQDKGTFMRGIVMKLEPPVPMVLACPNCLKQHIDRGVWATTRVHRTHLCEFCGSQWKPFEYATVGIDNTPNVVERHLELVAAAQGSVTHTCGHEELGRVCGQRATPWCVLHPFAAKIPVEV